MVIREDFYIKASNGGHNLFSAYWLDTDQTEFKGIFHIAHGMGEDILKYDNFAQAMALDGYVVCGMDMAGHGHSIDSPFDFGYFGEGEDNCMLMVDDLFYLMKIMKSRFPNAAKYFIMGHSFGSYLVREFMVRYGRHIDGVCLMGTSDVVQGLDAAAMLCRVEMEIFGPKSEGTVIFRMGIDWLNRKFMPTRTDFDWICSDEAVVDKYFAGSDKKFAFTYSGYINAYHLVKEITSKDWFRNVRRGLPILIISGEQDALGDFGKGIKRVYNGLKKAGCRKVTMHLFAGCRHELLSEKRKADVYKYIINWTDKQVIRDN
ncbi:MAG: alpha/beta fold hydrolase [Firmicutes bacterium]|nr:alpha/beta fold hydrolase [Bacillota bacterium]